MISQEDLQPPSHHSEPQTFNAMTDTAAINPSTMHKIKIDAVPGLTLIKNFITEAEESYLWTETEKLPWFPFGKRKWMVIGYRHDGENGEMTYHEELPKPYDFVIDRISENFSLSKRPQQCVVNHYEAGQGIGAHFDRVEDFGEEVIGLSLGSGVMMELVGPKEAKVNVFLPRRSVYLLEGDARYKWKHGIPARKKDRFRDGTVNVRKNRISLTFRTVKLGFKRKDVKLAYEK